MKITNQTEKNEKWMRGQIRARGFVDSLSQISLSGRYAEARQRVIAAEHALKVAEDSVEACLKELETRFPKTDPTQDIGIRL